MPYLMRVVQRTALKALGRLHRDEQLSVPDLRGGLADDPEALALANSSSAMVTDELAQMPRRQKVIALTTDGHSPAEIAGILGIEANAVHVHLHRARAKIRIRLSSADVVAA